MLEFMVHSLFQHWNTNGRGRCEATVQDFSTETPLGAPAPLWMFRTLYARNKPQKLLFLQRFVGTPPPDVQGWRSRRQLSELTAAVSESPTPAWRSRYGPTGPRSR